MKLSHWIMISGTGRNCGKTTLACRLLEHFRPLRPAGVKISPHFHPLDGDEEVLERGDGFLIIRERKISTKDSSRMLQAGAGPSLFVQVREEARERMLEALLRQLDPGQAVICESGGMRELVSPGLFILMKHEKDTPLPDAGSTLQPGVELTFQDIEGFITGERLHYDEKGWTLR
ncbi:MAG: hypothetical protein ACOYXB_08185 [Bacteroidota bacterium]